MDANTLEKTAIYSLMLLDHYFWKRAPASSPLFALRGRLVQKRMNRAFPDERLASPLPELSAEGLSREHFLEASCNMRKPVVIRGFIKETRAVRLWNLDYLEEQIGDTRCLIWGGQPLYWDELWNRRIPMMEVPFREFAERMQREPLYLNNSTELIMASPRLLEDLELHRIQDGLCHPQATWKELSTTQLFLGSLHVGSPLHHAMGGNFFMQIAGRKRWTLIDPRHTATLHPVPAHPFQSGFSAHGSVRLSRGQDNGSAPIFKRFPRYEVVLEPGDLLLNTSWWWHEVENLDPCTIGCAVRHAPPPFERPACWDNHPFFTLISTYPIFRAMVYAHYMRQRLTGHDTPLFVYMNQLISNFYRRGLTRQ